MLKIIGQVNVGKKSKTISFKVNIIPDVTIASVKTRREVVANVLEKYKIIKKNTKKIH